jgi:hypothetical protein
MRSLFALLAVLLLVPAACAQSADPWSKLQFLLGTWTGVAGREDTQIGSGQGVYSFEPELDKKIIVRHNSSTYSSGAKHDDLMVIYLDGPAAAPCAIYFDSEGHVIRYELSFPGQGSVVFASDASALGPKYRLTYWMDGASLRGRFEIAAPASEFKTYMQWTSAKR